MNHFAKLIARNATCICCQRPNTAFRTGQRCASCSEVYQRLRAKCSNENRRNVAALAEAEVRERMRLTGEMVGDTVKPTRTPWYEHDADIERYRAEKRRRDARNTEDALVQQAIAETIAFFAIGHDERVERGKRSAAATRKSSAKSTAKQKPKSKIRAKRAYKRGFMPSNFGAPKARPA